MIIKSKIRSSYYGKLLIGKYHEIKGKILPKIVSDEKAVIKYYKKNTGKNLNLMNPITFSEKMNWYKLNARNPLMVKCADKVAVRDYVSQCGYPDCLNQLFGVYSSVDDIDISKFPNKFVLKAAHGTHMNFIVTDKNTFNWKHAKSIMRSWLKQDIYWWGREWVYKDIPKRIIVEKYLEDDTGELRDFKFFCFNGIPRVVQVDIGRFSDKHIRNYYDINWNYLNFHDDVESDGFITINKPSSYDKMIEIATNLSKPFQFVRVDFYELNGHPFVGELTFFHNGGLARMEPEEWDKKFGDYWELVKE